MSDRNYYCQECDGDGEVECCECGQETTCDACDGTGFDPHEIDLDKIREFYKLRSKVYGLWKTVTDRYGRKVAWEKKDGSRKAIDDFAFDHRTPEEIEADEAAAAEAKWLAPMPNQIPLPLEGGE